jgi:hypothetical protein
LIIDMARRWVVLREVSALFDWISHYMFALCGIERLNHAVFR